MTYQQRQERLAQLRAQYQEALQALKEAELAIKWFEAQMREKGNEP